MTGASPAGTTNMVRRMPSIRSSSPSWYRARSTAACPIARCPSALRAHAAMYTDAGSVPCRAIMAAATSAAVCALAGAARRCRRASLALRSATDPRDHVVTRSPRCPVLAGRLEDDDRDLPGGLLLVFGEPRVGGLVRCPDLFPLRAFGYPGVDIHGLGADLRR